MAVGTLIHRFPLEWIGEDPGQQEARWRPSYAHNLAPRSGRRRTWAMAGGVWLSGLMMGSVMMGTAMSRRDAPPKSRATWSDQIALSAGYRALLFKPMPLVNREVAGLMPHI